MLEYKGICRLCGSSNLRKCIDLGLMPLAGQFLKKEDILNEKKYPLRVFICEDCGLTQILDVIPPEVLFKDYRYTSSTTITLREHFRKYAEEISSCFLQSGGFVVEIGSNDGVLLLPLKQLGIDALGIEPASNIAEIAKSRGLNVINNFFNTDTVKKILNEYGKANAIFANNVLAHIDDMNELMYCVKLLLHETGVLVFEVQYLLDLVEHFQYDFIYHEHLCYHSLKPLINFLEKYDMKIFDVKKIPIHGGSIRVYATSKSNKNYEISKKILEMLETERKVGLHTYKGIYNLSEEISYHKEFLVDMLKKIKKEGKTISGYGASGRGVILTNYCGIDKGYLEYVVDASPERYGRLMPGSHVKIVSPNYLRKNPTDTILMIAWTYKDEILEKEEWFLERGGEFIVPLPKPVILSRVS